MKKKVLLTTIIGLILMLGGLALFLFMGNIVTGLPGYSSQEIFASFGTILTQEFTKLGIFFYVNIGLCGVLFILLLVQIVMAIKKKHGPAVGISITTLLGIAAVFFFITLTFLPGGEKNFGWYEVFIGLMTASTPNFLALVYFIPALLFLIGFILFLIGLISELQLLAELPDPVKDARTSDEVMVIHDEDLSSDESARAAEAALASGGYPERHAATMVPPAAPGIQGPLLVQYINTYSPAGGVAAEPAAKKNSVPVSEIQGAITGEKPLTADDIRKIVQEEMGGKKDQPVIVNVPTSPKAEEKGLSAEDVRAIFSEELGRYLSVNSGNEGGEDSEILVEEEPAPALTAEDVRSIIAAELAKAKPEPEPEPAKKEEEPIDVRAVIRDELEAHRRELDEENKRKAAEEEAAKAREAELAKAREEAAEEARRKAEEANKAPSLTAEDIRSIIAAELEKKKPEEPKKESEMTLDLIREVIRSELKDVAPVKEEKVQPVTVVLKESDIVRPTPAPEPEPAKEPEVQMPVVNIIVKSPEAPKEEPAPEPEPEPEPEPAPEPEVVQVRAVGVINPELPPHEKIIRIPFPTRMIDADKEMKSNYNELKSEILSYGVKSRVSNSGDTFRLHKVTFVKVTIAGKSLKLYFALDPKDYANSTLPVDDAGHKGTYRDIPLVFKVKSDLSLRRAKLLIADVMEKNGLEQGKIEPHNWADELKDYKPTGSDKDDD
jgi:hypothetical protein